MVNRVSPEWFRTVRIPLLAGRDFTADDRLGSPRVVIVNETLAKAVLERRARSASDWTTPKWSASCGDSKYWTLGETIRPTVYTAYAQRPEAEVELFVRTSDVAGTREGAARGNRAARPDEVRRRPADDRRRQRGTRAGAGSARS